VIAERDTRGGTRCTTLRSSPPLSLRPTPDGLQVVGSAAGPIGGDDVSLDLTVVDGGELTIRTVAAQVALPGPRPVASRAAVTVTIGERASLRWLPEPLVLADGCDHRTTVTMFLAPTASVVWRDEIVLGRHCEPSGSLLQRLRVDRDGQPLFRNDLALGPGWPGSEGPAGTGGARVAGTLLIVGEAAVSVQVGPLAGVRVALCRLADDAVLVTALADTREVLHQILATVGSNPPPSDRYSRQNRGDSAQVS